MTLNLKLKNIVLCKKKKKKKKSSKRDLLKYFYEFVFKMLKKLMSYTYRNKMNIKRKKKM